MKNVVITHSEIQKITKDIGEKITDELKNEKLIPIVIGIMKGSMNFMMDVVKNINTNVFIDYIQVSSYSGTFSSGNVVLKRQPSFNLKDRTIIVVEDIIDTGVSMDYLLKYLNEHHHPKKIILAALVDKRSRRQKDIHIDYAGIVLKDDYFLYGYGLDYNELGRNLPDIYALTSDEVKELSIQIAQGNL